MIVLIPIFLIIWILLRVYLPWFQNKEIVGGDWPTYYQEFLQEQRILPSLWSTFRGAAGAVTPLLNLETFQSSLIVPWVNWIGLSWNLVYKVGWFGLFLILGAVSSLSLSQIIFYGTKRKWAIAMSVLVYLTNTYVLMVLSGGQMGVALAYALFPLVLVKFIKLGNSVLVENKLAVKEILTAGVVLSIQLIFDIRFVYLSAVAASIYWLFSIYQWHIRYKHMPVNGNRLNLVVITISVVTSIGLAALLNAFWLLPTLATASRTVSELGAIYTSSGSVHFFSFADFSHAFSLLHPNWPENIFGKTYFLAPEFILLPLSAFASLVFISKKNKRNNLFLIGYFNFLALVGIFLAKGANEPLGALYLWLFDHIPGFVMFRDPTKWYVFTAVSFAILIPFTVEMFLDYINSLVSVKKVVALFEFILRLTIIFLWIFLIRQAFFGGLSGTFRKQEIPHEYLRFTSFITSQPEYFRTLWIPKQSRFGPVSGLHPAFSSEFISNASTAAEFAIRFDSPDMQNYLDELAVKYVVVPDDVMGEIFLEDRHYDPRQRAEWERYLDNVDWLKKISTNGITVYETVRHNDHFWMSNGKILGYRMLSPDRYEITLTSQSRATLFFSEGFHPGWQLQEGSDVIISNRTSTGLNSFNLPQGFSGKVEVYFYPETYVQWGSVVSVTTFIGVIIFYILRFRRDKK